MLSIFKNKYTYWITQGITFSFILLFLYAGFTKLIDGSKFYDNVNNSPILGGELMASIISWIVPIAELAVASLLSWSKTRLFGMYAGLGLLMIFTAYIAGVLFFSPYIPCSCGGVTTLLSWDQHLLFNLLCIILAVFGIALMKRQNREISKIGDMNFSGYEPEQKI